MHAIRRFDLYRKVPKDLTEPTLTGSVISILCGIFMVALLLSEFTSYLQLDSSSELYVQQEEAGKLRLNFDMTFPHLPCFVFSLDVLDIMGRHEVGVSQGIAKTRLGVNGEDLGMWADGAEVTHELATEMRVEGCNVRGYVYVNKVPGNFHISAHGMQTYVQNYLGGQTNVAHIVNSFWAGDVELEPKDFPGSLRPLDGVDRSHEDQMTTYEYFLDIIPTIYSNPRNVDTKTYQMTSHTHSFGTSHQHMPAVYFRYQLSPITVEFKKRNKSFMHFLTYVCAIVGGVFTVAGLLNSMIQSSVVAVQKNILGKGE